MTDELDETFFVDLSSPSVGATIADGQGLGTILNDDAPASPNDMYVGDIGFDTRLRGKGGSKHDERILVTVRHDSDVDGVAEGSDAVVAGATVTVEVSDASGLLVATLSGTTDSLGVFTSTWLTDLPDGLYTALITDISLDTFTWNQGLGQLSATHDIAD